MMYHKKMNDVHFIKTFVALFDKRTMLHNDKIALPAPIRKMLPHIKAGLIVSHRELLSVLSKYGDQTILSAANKLRYSPRYTRSLTADLLCRDFVQKIKCAADTSSTWLRITLNGQKLLDENREMWVKYIKSRTTEIMNEQERLKLLDCLMFVNHLYACLYDNKSYTPSNIGKYNNSNCEEFYQSLCYELNISASLINAIAFDPKHYSEKNQNFIRNNCITQIYYNEPISMSELANISFIALKTVSMIVTRYVEKGMVERFQKPGDRRVYYVQMTETGRKFLDDAKTDFSTFLSELFKDLLPECKQKLIDSLEYINEILGKF